MRRLVVLVLALAAAVPAAAAERQSLAITFINGGGLFGVGPDDSSVSVIREHLCPPGGADCPVVKEMSWSPDGTQIAFLRDGGSSEAHLNTIRADGTDMRQLSSLPIDVVLGAQPAWSPDGSMLAITTSANSPVDLLTGSKPGRDLYVVPADGSREKRLTESGERGVSDRGPTWSADGSRLAFESLDREKLAESALYTVRADGACERRIAAVDGWHPVWQPLLPAGIGPHDCADLAVVGADLNSRQAARLTVTLLNDGTRPLDGVRIRSRPSSATIMSATSSNARCLAR